MNYINLHNHSRYSILDGFSSIEDMVSRAKELGMEGLALTDHGTTSGLIKFYKECKKQNIKPILGAEFYIAEDRFCKTQGDPKSKNYHMVLLAKTIKGYHNILKLSSLSNIEGFYYKPRIDFDLLEQYHEDIIALNGCVKNILLSRQSEEELDLYCKKIKAIFGEDYYIELMPFPTKFQIESNSKLLHIANKYNFKTVITCDSHYVIQKDWKFHDAIFAIRDKKLIKDTNRAKYDGPHYYIRSYEDIITTFKNSHPLIPNSVVLESLQNTLKIAEECNVEIKFMPERIPKFNINIYDGYGDAFINWKNKNIEKIKSFGAKNEYDEFLLYLITKNWKERLGHIGEDKIQEYKDRIKYELKTIFEVDFSSYFIIVQDYVNFARNNNILIGVSRGSVGGSLAAYLVGITDLDPIPFNLSFERFLVPGRVSAPDIDLDFEESKREQIIDYLLNKYGKYNCCKVNTFGFLKAKSAIRDAGRALGYSQQDVNNILKQIEFYRYKKMSDTLEEDIKFVVQDPKNKKLIEQHRSLFVLAYKIYDDIKSQGIHAAAFIIFDEELSNYTAIRRIGEDKKFYVSQYDKDDLKEVGVMKFDILSIRNLDTIKRVIDLTNVKLKDIPLDDADTFANINKGDVTGVFMCETSSAKSVLRNFTINNIDDLVAFNAINRTGPLEAKANEIYEKNKAKPDEIYYPNNILKEVLSSTYGCLVYQEQLMEIARKMAGFSHSDADKLRKQISAKDMGKFNEMKDMFVEGSVKLGYKKIDALNIWQDMSSFARYAFNKSHSVGYAIIAYYTAYLKTKYPKEFLIALINTDKKENIGTIIRDFSRKKIIVEKPNINLSKRDFTIYGENKVISGFNCIKGLGDAIIDELTNKQPYRDLNDFLNRIDLSIINKRIIQSFIQCDIIPKELHKLPTKMLCDDYNITSIIKYYKNKDKNNYGLFDVEIKDLCKNKIYDDFDRSEIREAENILYTYGSI